jgi:hypothetical protein
LGKRVLPILIACAWTCAICGVAVAQTLGDASPAPVLRLQSDLPVTAPPWIKDEETPHVSGLHSPWAASGLSLLLPGAGHVYGGARGRARLFFGTEAVIWGLALAFDRHAAWRSDEAIDYAVQHAQLDPVGKDEDFLGWVAFHDSRDDFNREGRAIDPSRPYLPQTRETYWQWDDPVHQQRYRDLRNASKSSERRRTFMFYTAIFNRVAAAVDAFWFVRRSNAREREREGLKLSVKPRLSFSNPGLSVHARFRF